MQNISSAKKLLSDDFNYFSSQLNHYLDKLNDKYNIEYKNNSIALKNIHDGLIKILMSSLKSDGKRIRPLFCYWVFRCFCPNNENETILKEQVTKIAMSIEILHNASLVVDDIQDGSDERRNKPALHLQFGLPNSLNAATWMYFLALTHLPPHLEILASNALIDCHVGQSLDLNTNQKAFAQLILEATVNERWSYYEKCVSLKTTRLIKLSLQCLEKTLNINSQDFNFIENIINKYGLIFQIFDDIKNLFPEFSGNKLNEDLKSGFRSAISMEFLNILPESEKESSFKSFQSGHFYSYMVEHNNYHQAIENCFLMAENLSIECSQFIDSNTNIDKNLRLYIAEIFKSPFLHMKEKLALKIKPKPVKMFTGNIHI